MVARRQVELADELLPTAIYCRISQRYAATEESLDSQEGLCSAYCRERSYVVPPELVFREKDSGYETADDRADILRLRELARRGKVGRVVVYNTDRFSREPIELLSLIKELRLQGCRVEFVLFDVDPTTPQGKVSLFIRSFADEIEWTQITERTTRKRREIRASGRRVGEGGPRFGYRWVKDAEGRITPARAWEEDPTAGPWVRLMYSLVVDHGYTLCQLAVELNARSIPTPSVYRKHRFRDGRVPKWDHSLVKHILYDETYKGLVYCNKSVMVGKKRNKMLPRDQWVSLPDAQTPALVTPEAWEKAVAMVRSNRQANPRTAAARTRNQKEFAFLRGLIFCGHCGAAMKYAKLPVWDKATKSHRRGVDPAYRCQSKDRLREQGVPKEDRCKGATVYDRKVRDRVWAEAWRFICDESLIDAEYARLKADRPGESLHRESLAAAEASVAGCDRKVANLVKGMAEADDPEMRALIRKEIDSLKDEKVRHAERAERLRAKVRAYDSLDRKAEELKEKTRDARDGRIDPDALTWPERRAFLDWIGARVIGGGTTLRIELDSGLGGVELAADPSAVEGSITPKSPNKGQRLWLQISPGNARVS